MLMHLYSRIANKARGLFGNVKPARQKQARRPLQIEQLEQRVVPAHAATTYLWLGGTSQLWSNAANWELPNAGGALATEAPTAADTLRFTNAGNKDSKDDILKTVKNLQVEAVYTHTITIATDSLMIEGGFLKGAGTAPKPNGEATVATLAGKQIIIASSPKSPFEWSGATIKGNVEVEATDKLTMAPAANTFEFYSGGTLTNHGTIDFSSGRIWLKGAASMVN